MADVIDFTKPMAVAPADPTYDYIFTLKDGTKIVEHGLLSFNPVFAGTVTSDGKLLFAIPMENVLTIKRDVERPALNG